MSYYNQLYHVRFAGIKKKRLCQKMHVSFSMNVRPAKLYSNQNKATAAFSALTVLCRVRRYRGTTLINATVNLFIPKNDIKTNILLDLCNYQNRKMVGRIP